MFKSLNIRVSKYLELHFLKQNLLNYIFSWWLLKYTAENFRKFLEHRDDLLRYFLFILALGRFRTKWEGRGWKVEDKWGWRGGGGELQIGVIWPCSERAVIQINGVGFRAFYLAMPLAPSLPTISPFFSTPPPPPQPRISPLYRGKNYLKYLKSSKQTALHYLQ